MTSAVLPVENVQEYPRPAVAEPVVHQIKIMFGGSVVAETDRAFRVLETHHAPTYYVPSDAIAAELRPVEGHSYCEWKGLARYYDVVTGDRVAPRAAWSYERPTAGFAPIAGYLSFYASKMDDCWVGGVRVEPQAGDFYGGWITPNLTGIVKGGPGTEHW